MIRSFFRVSFSGMLWKGKENTHALVRKKSDQSVAVCAVQSFSLWFVILMSGHSNIIRSATSPWKKKCTLMRYNQLVHEVKMLSQASYPWRKSNLTNFFIICFCYCNFFDHDSMTVHKPKKKMLEQLTKLETKIKYPTRSVNVKEKIVRGSGPSNINSSSFVITFE